ncbi:MAG TPA: aldo/keto reductase [bacterium]|nr:aldo/keto reductase [bacterium]
MKYRVLGASGPEVSEISLGCWTLGGLNWVNGDPNGWADVDEAEVEKAVHHALDAGVNHFDNADVYGNGKAERLLARALGPRVKKLILATKVGWFPGTAAHAYEPAHIRHQCEQSLINLKRDVIDLYYFHHGNFGEKDLYLDDAVAVMRKLKQEGKIRLIGQSAYSSGDFERLVPKVQPDVLQSWGHIMDDQFIREGSPVRRLLEERRMRFVAFSPLNQGVLLGKFDPQHPPKFEAGDHRLGDKRFTTESLLQVQPKLEKLKARFGGEVKDMARVALQYVLSHPVVACVIPGFRNLRQVQLDLEGADKPLSPEDVAFVRGTFNNI